MVADTAIEFKMFNKVVTKISSNTHSVYIHNGWYVAMLYMHKTHNIHQLCQVPMQIRMMNRVKNYELNRQWKKYVDSWFILFWGNQEWANDSICILEFKIEKPLSISKIFVPFSSIDGVIVWIASHVTKQKQI